MNKVFLIGRLTKDPVAKTANDGASFARFTIAVDRRAKKDEAKNADFISCVAFGKTAEFVGKYLTKGVKVAVSGRITTGSYENTDGKKIYTTDVISEEVEFCEKKSAEAAAPADNPDQWVEAADFDGLPFA